MTPAVLLLPPVAQDAGEDLVRELPALALVSLRGLAAILTT